MLSKEDNLSEIMAMHEFNPFMTDDEKAGWFRRAELAVNERKAAQKELRNWEADYKLVSDNYLKLRRHAKEFLTLWIEESRSHPSPELRKRFNDFCLDLCMEELPYEEEIKNDRK